MIWLIGYFAVALIAAPFFARFIVHDISGGTRIGVDGGDYALAAVAGLLLGCAWPLALGGLIVARIAFPHLFVKREEEAEK